MITELAEYEQARHEVLADETHLEEALFGPSPSARCLVACDPGPIGFALWFTHYSTWLGRPGLYLEDLYVRPASRGRGYGLALMRELARICVAEDCPRFEWSVLDWNAPSIAFYDSIGATPQSEWVRYRLSGEALDDFARGS